MEMPHGVPLSHATASFHHATVGRHAEVLPEVVRVPMAAGRTRREFLQLLGVTLASTLVTRCRPSCYTPLPPTPPPTASVAEGQWAGVRAAWYGLDQLAIDAKDADVGELTRDRLMVDHRAALDRVVASGALAADVADDMQAAFDAACTHVWRANAPITCYAPSPYPEYRIASSSDLAQQADLLADMATASDIDPATVAQARAAIERDIAFLAATPDDQRAIVDAVIAAAGESMDYPTLKELELDVPPAALEAARTLVEVLLREL